MNPARSLGPAVFVGGWALGQLWMFIVAPLMGAMLVSLVYRLFNQAPPVITTAHAERSLVTEQQARAEHAAATEDLAK